jgi:competence protein ComEC
LLNLVAVPWMALLLTGCLLWGILALIEPELGARSTPMIDLLAQPLSFLGAIPPGPWLSWPVSLTFVEASIAALGLLGALILRRTVFIRVLALAVALLFFHGPAAEPTAELVMLDVGQGDSLLLRDGRRATLIDGGGWPRADIAARVLVPVLAARGVRFLDSLIVTHSDIDHCQGIADLAHYIPVSEVVMASDSRGSPCIRRLTELPWIALRETEAGDSWSLGRWRLRTIHPERESSLRGNNGSLVLQVSGFGKRILLTGDIERAAELAILRREPGTSLASHILKVAHHGSGTSSSDPFLRAVSPRLGLISAGRTNRYGHPSPLVIDRFRRAGVFILRTDRDGMVRLSFRDDGAMRIERIGPLDWYALH